MKKVYDKICRVFSIKIISWMSLLLFLLLMVPLIYLSFVNRASGDDYSYGMYTHQAWVTSYSLIEVWKAIVKTIKQYYVGWQGTWFSIFLFTLQPEVFHPGSYWLTFFLNMFLLIGSTTVLFHYLLGKRLGVDKYNIMLVLMIFLLIEVEWIPSTKSALFWYNGAMHYLLPYAFCLLTVVFIMRFLEGYKLRYLLGCSILMSLLGGSNYQAALFVLIAVFYLGIYNFICKYNKKIYLLGIPAGLELIGLFISMKAPGNKVRGGEAFGLSFSKGIETVGLAFYKGIIQCVDYLKEKPIVFVGFLIILVILIHAFLKREQGINVRFAGILCGLLWCLYSAMFAPEIYAGVEVSSGVYNMNYQTFLLVVFGVLILMADKIADLIKRRTQNTITSVKLSDRFYRQVTIPIILLCLVAVLFLRGNLKDSTTYVCIEYIVSGQAADYKEQMDLQTELMLDESKEDVLVPFINDIQGPLMHMPVTADKEAWTNRVTAGFYGKNSVIGMPREEWMDIYGKS